MKRVKNQSADPLVEEFKKALNKKPKKEPKRRKKLLALFIKNKCDEYDEPKREKRQRGDSVRFGIKKYLATLWLLSNLTTKEIARKVGISVALLRKWKTEEVFKEMVWKHEGDYVAYHRNVRCKMYERIKDNIMNPDLVDALISDRYLSGYDDYDLYKADLIFDIVKNIMKEREGMTGCTKSDIFSFIYAFDLVMEVYLVEQTIEYIKTSKELLRSLILTVSFHQRKILSKPKFSGEDRKKALILALLISKYSYLLLSDE